MFHFRWEEFNTSAATRREDSDFGVILLDRVAPEALGGTSKRYFTDVSYVYELTAPMETVIDMTERDRTEQLSAPLKRPYAITQSRFLICAHRRSSPSSPRSSWNANVVSHAVSYQPLPPITARTVSSGPKSSAPST